MIRIGEEVGYEGALYTLQEQSGLSVHLGGRTALSLLGRAHYLDFNVKKIFLFCKSGTKLPTWFLEYDWENKIEQINTSFLPSDIDLSAIEQNIFHKNIKPGKGYLGMSLFNPKNPFFFRILRTYGGVEQPKTKPCTSLA
ncbi:AbiEi antitoxin N-terminal domain-containing protein [Flavivirga sp. 57AJ16]|uniref:AbiEi antitoxin N-terminal domain-containing protein n=1 Tax=Flavivirga sp. 57AJ16 TaxID=3025307 RepID=UPI002366A559|nr:AbiEi antitoxin N-terminal domain-containing protein [Flavivirga sp. 57AJ16]MDD7886802.1 AbiEi antitoxin N-terminal domain-containing protein [Flavivirga sp. 57AJ16]